MRAFGGRLVAAHSIRSRILKPPGRSYPAARRPGVAAHSIRSRILKLVVVDQFAVNEVSRSPFDPFEDTETCLPRVQQPILPAVAAHSIRSRILKRLAHGTVQWQIYAVAAHSIRSRILKLAQPGVVSSQVW